MSPSSDPPSRRTPYARFLTVLRILYLPAVVAAGLIGLIAFVAILGGARHASGQAVGQALGGVLAVGVLAVGLPMLVFVPDRGPGSLVRFLHGLGALGLAAVLGLSGFALWKQLGEPWWNRLQVEHRLANLSLAHARAVPIEVGGTLVGVQLEAEFALARDVALDRVGAPVAEAMRSLRIEVADPKVFANPFSHHQEPVAVTRDGQPVGGTLLPAGRYRATQVRWLVGVHALAGDEAPCTDAKEPAAAHRRESVTAADAVRWVVAAAHADSGNSLIYRSGGVIWQARSAPLDLRIDGSAWLAGFDSLPLPTCEARQAALEAARLRARMDAFFANRLPPGEASQVLHAMLCADGIDPLRELVAHGIPHQPIYAMAMRCMEERRRPEMLEVLGERLVVHPEDQAMHCSALRGLHRGLAVDRLRALARAGLPIDCATPTGGAWREGLQPRSPAHTAPEELAREIEWIRLLVEHKVPVCAQPVAGPNVWQRAVVGGTVEHLAAWLDAGCNPAQRADPATSAQPGWENYSARLLWLLRRHQVRNPSAREWPRLSDNAELNASVTRRLGLPDARELNTPFARRGGVVPLHDFASEALAAPRLLRELVDLGARLDAASDAAAEIFGANRSYTDGPGSWFRPGYRREGIPNIHTEAALDVLTAQELRTLFSPVNLTTGRPAPPMPQATDFANAPYGLAYYLCKRNIQACRNPEP
ncbi:MAG: hypothetical protein JNK22_06165 [Rhodocyclaceae bacterium]|nr:hypothetical protein [Rhodocyclaceae bacterium]